MVIDQIITVSTGYTLAIPVLIMSRGHGVFPKDLCNVPDQAITNFLLGEDSEKHNYTFRPQASK